MESSQKQFVVQQHTTPEGIHWDLMLEMDETLWTWRLNVPPVEIKNKPIPAERIHDHQKRFLTYEGPVQNNTGHVQIADRGLFQIIEQTENMLMFLSQGVILKGTFVFSKALNAPLWTLELQSGSIHCLP